MLTLAFVDGEAPAHHSARQVVTWPDDCGDICGRAYSRGDLHWIEWRGVGLFEFSSASLDVKVWPEPTTSREAVADVFTRMLQPVILQVLGWQTLHAGAAAGPAGVLAFCGMANSGKSTLAYAMQDAGLQQFADDALVLNIEQTRVMACPVPFVPRLRPASQNHFAHSLGSSRFPPSSTFAEIPLKAAFVLRQNACIVSPRISLLSQGSAFSELLAHAHCFDVEDPTQTRRLVDDYAAIASRVPVFRLEYRPDFQHLPKLTRAVVEAATQFDASTASGSKLRPTALLR